MEKFTLAPDGVDPAKVPTRTLYSGRIPAIGLGTFGSDRFTADQVAAAVRERHRRRLSAYRLCLGLRQ